ncbi:MAG: rod shape-determining protein MreC [Hyphomicrobium sp.]|nr:rod shape-determining protein MreC [Hyphomicrobium sp.]
MGRLRHDKLNLTRRGSEPSGPARIRVALPALVLICLGLLLLSRVNHSMLANARWRIAEWMSPVLQAAMVPLEPVRHVGRQIAAQVDMTEELRRLKTENQKLANWEWRARQLERKLLDLEALTKTVQEPKIDFVTSRVIADSSGAFVRSVMIDAGETQKVHAGYPVINADGLVGRVIETGLSSSRVLLVNDLNSRIPVVVGKTSVRAVMAGDNGAQPKLLFMPPDAKIMPGDDVATSGTGGLFPRGLRIGVVTGDPAAPRVKLRADLDVLEYLSVLFYDTPALDVPADASVPGVKTSTAREKDARFASPRPAGPEAPR